MIRFIRIGDQILDGRSQFAFYDTVKDRFISIYGEQVFDSLEDLKQAAYDLDPDMRDRLIRLASGRVIRVCTSGCFDILHAGHVRVLHDARAHGEHLTVLLNSDESVRRLKGDDRPINSVQDRIDMLKALRCVDRVVVFDEDTPSEALVRLYQNGEGPAVYAKGMDYFMQDIPERMVVQAHGGFMAFIGHTGQSTTDIVRRIKESL